MPKEFRDWRYPEPAVGETTRACPECHSASRARRCAFCTVGVAPA